MSHTWNFNHQKQEQVVPEEEENRYPRGHVPYQQNQNHLDPMSNKCEVTELTWENGQLAMHRLGSNLPNDQITHTWGKAGDTLESIVHQATCQKQNHSSIMRSDGHNHTNIKRDKNATTYGDQWKETSSTVKQQTKGVLKRMRPSDSDPQLYGTGRSIERISPRASAKDNDITMVVTWPCNEDSASHGGSENKEEGHKTIKGSNSLKLSRRAAVHNQSERRRRERINQKMKALQKLVPNASKTDKASMLEEVIKYLKQLQAQVELISSARNMEQQMMMMMMQPHIQMPLLARMGGLSLGMGSTTAAGMLNNMTPNLARPLNTAPVIYPTSIATPSCHPFISPAFPMASSIPTPASGPVTKAEDTYNAFLAQSMKMEFNNEMAAQYLQQANNQSMQRRTSKLTQENVNIQGQKE
ncbi:unnamed protein product [Withania somnifera]